MCNIKLSKTHLSKIGQSRGLLSRLLEPLLKTVLSLMKNALKPLGKKVLIPLGLTTARSATDAAVQNKIFGHRWTTLIISNEEINIMKIVKSLEGAGLLIKGVTETIKNEAKEKGVYLLVCY